MSGRLAHELESDLFYETYVDRKIECYRCDKYLRKGERVIRLKLYDERYARAYHKKCAAIIIGDANNEIKRHIAYLVREDALAKGDI